MRRQQQRKQKPAETLAYQAYLIRLWQDGYQSEWRASAQSVQSGETTRFGSLNALLVFLRDQTCEQAE